MNKKRKSPKEQKPQGVLESHREQEHTDAPEKAGGNKLGRVLAALLIIAVPIAGMFVLGHAFPYKENASATSPPATTTDETQTVITDLRIAFTQDLPAPWRELDQTELEQLGATTGEAGIDSGYVLYDPLLGLFVLTITHYPFNAISSLDILFPPEKTGTREDFLNYWDQNERLLKKVYSKATEQQGLTDSLTSSIDGKALWVTSSGTPVYAFYTQDKNTLTEMVFLLEKEGTLFYILASGSVQVGNGSRTLQSALEGFLQENLIFVEQ